MWRNYIPFHNIYYTLHTSHVKYGNEIMKIKIKK